MILGQGWDERAWPDPRPPDRAELDRAGGGRIVYLARVDVHSAVVSTAVLDRLPGIADAAGFAADGLLTREAHHRARVLVNDLLSDDGPPGGGALDAAAGGPARRGLGARAGRSAPRSAGGPDPGARGRGRARAWTWSPTGASSPRRRRSSGRARSEPPGWPVTCASTARSAPGPPRCTAPYADAEHRGARYLDDDEIADHLIECTRAGLQAGFHCIGDDAVAAAVDGLRRAAAELGVEAGPAAPGTGWSTWRWWRPADIPTLAELGVVASVQPAFDAGVGQARASCTRPGWARSGRGP